MFFKNQREIRLHVQAHFLPSDTRTGIGPWFEQEGGGCGEDGGIGYQREI